MANGDHPIAPVNGTLATPDLEPVVQDLQIITDALQYMPH
jgi:hypothetical protein